MSASNRELRPRSAGSGFRIDWVDGLLAAGVLVGTVAYLSALPHNLSPADESVYLYQAKRILAGEVLYRDVFEITTPGWMYLMALLFRLFGTSIETARMAMAVIHALTAVLIYFTCRRIGIRRALSWPPALAYVVVCQPAWPIASQHWLGTCLSVALLLTCSGPARVRASWAVLPGIVVGLLVDVHQQRGLMLGVGVFSWLIVDRALLRRSRQRPSASVVAELACFVAGAALAVVPLVAGAVVTAGFDNVWRALVIHPLFNYRATTHCAWGQLSPILAEQGSYTFPRLLKFLPLILLMSLARLAVSMARRRATDEVRALALLIVFCLASILSIVYYPDFIHIAFIAPIFFIAAAENLEWAARTVPVPAVTLRTSGWIAAAAFLIACGVRLQHNRARSWAAYPFSRLTAFGRVDFAREFEVRLYEQVRDLMRTVPSRQLFCYPILSYLYLMADADNPTRFQYFLPGYSTPEQIQEVIEVLGERKLPYIVAFIGFVRPDDPIVAYLRRDYEPLSEAGDVGQAIFRRKPDAGAARAD